MSNINDIDMSTLAMLGSAFKGTPFDKAFTETFKEKYKELLESGTDAMTAFSKANAYASLEALKQLPLLFRLNYLLNTLVPKNDENEENKVEAIDWELVNKILNANLGEFEYRPDKKRTVNSMDELKQYRVDVELAMNEIQPWIVKKCKDCKNSFSMNFGEVEYFSRKNMSIPKRCPVCRKAKKVANVIEEASDNHTKPIAIHIVDSKKINKKKDKSSSKPKFKETDKTSVPVPEETAMAKAMKNAGII